MKASRYRAWPSAPTQISGLSGSGFAPPQPRLVQTDIRMYAFGMRMAATHSTPGGHAAASHEPAWQIARLFPAQGEWTDGAYASFTESLRQLRELVDGQVETPTKTHRQNVHAPLAASPSILRLRRCGDAFPALYRVRLRLRGLREPDITVYRLDHLDRFGERFRDVRARVGRLRHRRGAAAERRRPVQAVGGLFHDDLHSAGVVMPVPLS